MPDATYAIDTTTDVGEDDVQGVVQDDRSPRTIDASSDSPCSSPTVSPSSSIVMAELSSSNRRVHALDPVTSFSARIFSSGSVSRCGRYRRAERR